VEQPLPVIPRLIVTSLVSCATLTDALAQLALAVATRAYAALPRLGIE
jgi:hypothetical protein